MQTEGWPSGVRLRQSPPKEELSLVPFNVTRFCHFGVVFLRFLYVVSLRHSVDTMSPYTI